MIAITEQLPLGTILGFLFLLATIIFVLTTTDSMSLTISMAITGSGDPPRLMRVFWAILMGAVATVLLTIWRKQYRLLAILYRCNSSAGFYFTADNDLDCTACL